MVVCFIMSIIYIFKDNGDAKRIYYMAQNYSILFLYEVFNIFDKMCKHSQLYHNYCIHKFSYNVSHITFGKLNRTNRKFLHY